MLPYTSAQDFFFDEGNEELLSSLKEILPGAIYHFKKLNNVNTFSTAKDFKKVSYDEAVAAIAKVTSPELLHEILAIEKRKKVLLAISENVFLNYEDAESLAAYAFKECFTELYLNLFAKQSPVNIFKLYETFQNEPKLSNVGIENLAALGTPKSFKLAKEINTSRGFNQNATLFSAACFQGSRVSTKNLLNFYVQENVLKPLSASKSKRSLDSSIKELARRVYKNGHESIIRFLHNPSTANIYELMSLINKDINSVYDAKSIYSISETSSFKVDFISYLIRTGHEFTLEDVILMKDNIDKVLDHYASKLTTEAIEFILSKEQIEPFLKPLKNHGSKFTILYERLTYPQRVVALENYVSIMKPHNWYPSRGEIGALYENGLKTEIALTYSNQIENFRVEDRKRLISEALKTNVLPVWVMSHLSSKQVDVYLEKLRSENSFFGISFENKRRFKELLTCNLGLTKEQRTYLASLLTITDFDAYFHSKTLHVRNYNYSENVDFDALVKGPKGEEYKKWASETFCKNNYLSAAQETFASSLLMHVSLTWKYANTALTREAYKAFKAKHGINPELWELFLTMFNEWEGTFESLLEVTENI